MKHKAHRIVSLNLLLAIMITLYYLHRFDNILIVCIYTIITAKLTRYFSTLPDYIEKRGHRTWAHSLISFMLIMLAILIIKNILFSLLSEQPNTDISYIELAYTILPTSILIGWGSHLLLDFFSDNGIPLLYPFVESRYQIYKFCSYNKDSNEQTLTTIMNYITVILIGFLMYELIKFFNSFLTFS